MTSSPFTFQKFQISFALDLKTIKVSSTFTIDHFQLFGLRQGLKMGNILKFSGQTKIVTRFHYSLVRHPLMTGLLIMFWFTPIMTIGKFTHFTYFSDIRRYSTDVRRASCGLCNSHRGDDGYL